MFVYLDNSSTTKQYREVNEIMLQTMTENFGNPSSLHRLGMNAEKVVKKARQQVADLLYASPEEVYFTSCGTESDNTALVGTVHARRRRGNRIITSKIEHPAILETCRKLENEGFQVIYIDVDQKGLVNMKQLKENLTTDTIMISIMAVNNEIGTIQPLKQINQIKENFNKENNADVLFHTDAVQALGKLPYLARYADMVSVSAHKIHGPKGMGALYIKKGLNIEPYIVGGGQERKFRSGTENVSGIAGFGLACEMAGSNFGGRVQRISEVREYLLEGIRANIDNIKINGFENACEESICSILSISFLRTRAEVILHELEQSEIYVSTGSACSSNKKGQSHVLKAINLNDNEIEGTVRFSLNEFNTIEEMDYVIEKLTASVNKFRKLGSFR